MNMYEHISYDYFYEYLYMFIYIYTYRKNNLNLNKYLFEYCQLNVYLQYISI